MSITSLYMHTIKGSLQPQWVFAHHRQKVLPTGGWCWAANQEWTKFSANSRHASGVSFRAIPELTISNSISPFHVSSSPHEADILTPFKSSHITLHTIITPSSDKLLGPKAEPGFHNNTALKIAIRYFSAKQMFQNKVAGTDGLSTGAKIQLKTGCQGNQTSTAKKSPAVSAWDCRQLPCISVKAAHQPFLHLVVTRLVLPPFQPQKSTGSQLMARCCCSTTSSLGLWKQSSRALDFLGQVVRNLMFISLSPALPQEPCWMAFVSRSWHSVTRSHHWTSKTVTMKAVCDEEKLLLEEWVYLSRAQALTKWQAPYNCPLQYFS